MRRLLAKRFGDVVRLEYSVVSHEEAASRLRGTRIEDPLVLPIVLVDGEPLPSGAIDIWAVLEAVDKRLS